MKDRESGSKPGVEELLSEYQRRLDAGEDLGFSEFCAAHPARAAELDQRWRAMDAALGGLADEDVADAHRSRQAFDQAIDDSSSFEQRYELHEVIGVGGMGRVLRVFDTRLRRVVAMKMLRERDEHGAATSAEIRRFFDEAVVTARLQHPGIAPVHDLGRGEDALPYFTMPLLSDGRTFEEVVRLVREQREEWSVTRAIGILIHVCDTVEYAHSKGVLHRDLKPSNVISGSYGATYVIDWGVAKYVQPQARGDQPGAAPALGDDLAALPRTFVGTPMYMAPEQALGQVVDHRCDVYAMGAMLYFLLTGHGPYECDGQANDTQTILERLRTGPPQSVLDREPGVAATLAAICAKAMRRAVGERYQGAAEFGRELRAFLDNRVVDAYRTGAISELRLWIRRNRALAGAFAAILVVALAGLAGISYVEKEGARDLARTNEELREVAYFDRVSRASLSISSGFGAGAARILDEAHADERKVEWAHLRAIADGSSYRLSCASAIRKLRASRRADWFVTASDDRTLRRWHLGKREPEPFGSMPGDINVLRIAPDDRFVYAGDSTGAVRAWDTRTWRQAFTRSDQSNGIADLAVGDRGLPVFVSVAGDRTLYVGWRANGDPLKHFRASNRYMISDQGRLALRPDRSVFVTAGDLPSIEVWPIPRLGWKQLAEMAWKRTVPDQLLRGMQSLSRSNAMRAPAKDWRIRELEFNASGTKLAGAGSGGLLIWNFEDFDAGTPASGLEPLHVAGGTADGGQWGCRAVEFTPDGERLAYSTYGTIFLVDATSGELVRQCNGHGARVEDVAFHHSGKWMISGDRQGQVVFWDLNVPPRRRVWPHRDNVRFAAVDPDGVRAAWLGWMGSLVVASLGSDVVEDTATGLRWNRGGLGFLHGGKTLLVLGRRERVERTYDHLGLLEERTVQAPAGRTWELLATHRDGPEFAFVSRSASKPARIVVVRHGKGPVAELEVVGHPTCLRLARGGRVLVAATAEGSVLVWDIGSAAPTSCTLDHSIASIDLHPTQDLLVVGTTDSRILMLAASTLRVLRHAEVHAGTVTALRFHGEERLISTGADGLVRYWRVRDLAPVFHRSGDGLALRSLDLARDGTLVTGGDGQNCIAWSVK